LKELYVHLAPSFAWKYIERNPGPGIVDPPKIIAAPYSQGSNGGVTVNWHFISLLFGAPDLLDPAFLDQ